MPTPERLPTRIGVFTATRWECKAVCTAFTVENSHKLCGYHHVNGRRNGYQVVVIQTGMGVQAATKACRSVLANESFDLIISTGFAGALNKSHIGDILIASEVVGLTTRSAQSPESTPVLCDPLLVAKAFGAAEAAAISARIGRISSVAKVLIRAEEKRQLAIETEAIGVDMESAAIGNLAQARQIPFLAARIVSDLADEDLPCDFNVFLRPRGWLPGLANMLMHPSSLVGLNRLRHQINRAAQNLSRFCDNLFCQLGTEQTLNSK